MEQQSAYLVSYIRSNPNFQISESIDGNYGHMGATLTDAVLQAGVKYETVVRPRVQQLLRQYSQTTTTSGFANLLDSIGAEELLDWHGRKLSTLKDLVSMLRREQIETESEFRAWITTPGMAMESSLAPAKIVS